MPECLYRGFSVSTTNSQELPKLGNLTYTADRYLETDSRMSRILLVTDRHKRKVILKIANVDQRSRAEANRNAIKNAANRLQQFLDYPGIINLRPISRRQNSIRPPWNVQRTYCSTLNELPDAPEFLTLEYLPGGSLRDYVGDARLDISRALQIGRQIADSLAYLHANDCVHRDVKPENILFRRLSEDNDINADSLPVLIDFGIAASVGEQRLVSGSRLWMAPELQEANEAHPLSVDPSWDVYAMGLILTYMITGRRPRRRKYEYHNYEQYRNSAFLVIDREAESLGEVGPPIRKRLKNLIGHSLVKAPAERLTAAEMAQEMDAVLQLLRASQSAAPSVRTKTAPLSAERSFFLPLAGVAGLVLIALILAATTLADLSSIGESAARAYGALFEDRANSGAAASLTADALAPPPTLVPTPLPTRIDRGVPTLVPITRTTTQSAAPTGLTAATKVVPNDLTPQARDTPNPVVAPAGPDLLEEGQIALLEPLAGVVSNHEVVDFVWALREGTLAPNYCFEPLFWAPGSEAVPYAPVGVIRDNSVRVSFDSSADGNNSDLLALLTSDAGFHWGVRLVLCASPSTVLQDVEESHTYTYVK